MLKVWYTLSGDSRPNTLAKSLAATNLIDSSQKTLASYLVVTGFRDPIINTSAILFPILLRRSCYICTGILLVYYYTRCGVFLVFRFGIYYNNRISLNCSLPLYIAWLLFLSNSLNKASTVKLTNFVNIPIRCRYICPSSNR